MQSARSGFARPMTNDALKVPADDAFKHIIAALEKGDAFDHPAPGVKRIETHISVVLLAGEFAYKFKKPLDLGFVDFSTLEKRRFYCEEELRLNRRLTPELYLDVVPIGGSPDAPEWGGEPAIEYCLKMRRFPQEAELDRLVAAGAIEPRAFAELGRAVAAFHESADVAAPDSDYGGAEQVREAALANFDALEDVPAELDLTADLDALGKWTQTELDRLAARMDERKRGGRVRECHGDMHLTNMVVLDGRIRLFDCIEFNPHLRWTDVMAEVAFLLMDLDDRGRPDLGRGFLNAYLEAGGDYPGLELLVAFKVYRSMVRAKVAWLRAGQEDAQAMDAQQRDKLERHVRLARRYIEPAPPPPLIITHGLSGSGKTTLTGRLLGSADAVRVRSDVERKRLAGLDAGQRAGDEPGRGLYSRDQSERTYERLERAARSVLAAGMAAIVDAAFLDRDRRRQFRSLAERAGCRFVILDCAAPVEELRRRVAGRAGLGQDASDADLAILERQLETAHPLSEEEQRAAVTVDTHAQIDVEALASRLGMV